MTTDDTEIVSALCLVLADRVGQERFDIWFGPSTQFRVSGKLLTVAAPNQFTLDWLRKHFRREIEAASLEAIGPETAVEFRVDPALQKRQKPKAEKAEKKAAPNLPAAANPAEPAGAAGPLAPRRFASLGTFVEGATNRLASASARRVPATLGAISPLLFHGPPGVGKTHLLEGIWSAVRRQQPRARVVYLSAEQFTSYFLEALHGRGLPLFRQKYRGVDLLLIDDVQFFAGKRATIVELLSTVDSVLREGRQLVFAADRGPAELTDLGPELLGRIAGGLSVEIEPADGATRRGIVAQMAQDSQLQLPADVLDLLAERLPGDARRLRGALNRLAIHAEAHRCPIDLPLAKTALGDLLVSARLPVRLPDIERVVCESFGLDTKMLRSQGKGKKISHPRMLAMWLARKHTGAALSEIGDYFGGRSHSTVISARKKVDGWIDDGQTIELSDARCPAGDALRRLEDRLRAG